MRANPTQGDGLTHIHLSAVSSGEGSSTAPHGTGSSEPQMPDGSAAGGGHGTDLDEAKLALETLKELCANESARSDRASARAREGFALAAGFFAVVQTVAVSASAAALLTAGEQRTVIRWAVLSAIALTVCGLAVLIAGAAFRLSDLDSDRVHKLYKESDSALDMTVSYIEDYGTILDSRRASNKKRIGAGLVAQLFAFASIGLVLVELICALLYRVQ